MAKVRCPVCKTIQPIVKSNRLSMGCRKCGERFIPQGSNLLEEAAAP